MPVAANEIAPSDSEQNTLLHALAQSAAALVAGSSLDEQIATALGIMGDVLGMDRVIVIEEQQTRTLVSKYVWVSTRMPGKVPALPPQRFLQDLTPDFVAWRTPLRQRDVVISTIDTVAGAVREIFRIMHIMSVILVPIFVEGEYWGNLGLDMSTEKRRWLPAEIEILKMFADLIGASITRGRYVKRLTDAYAIVKNSSTILCRMKADSAASLTYVSDNVSQYGYSAKELTGSPSLYPAILHPDDLAAVLADLRELHAGAREEAHREIRVRKPDGSYVWFDGNIHSVRDPQGALTGFEGVLVEITARKHAETQLAYVNTVLTTALESSPDGILVVDANARVVSFNRRFAELFSVPLDIMRRGDDERVLKLVTAQMKDESAFLERVRYLYNHPDARSDEELELKDGRFIERHTATLSDAKRQYLGRIWFFHETTERKRAELKIEELARTDTLTGLANRPVFLERLNAAFAGTKRGGEPFAILYLDIDHFKDVNDTLGHAAGDALLKAVAKRLLHAVRDSDFIARLGGDEFAILQSDLADVANAGTLAAKIRSQLAQPHTIDGSEVHITTSIGIAYYAAETASPVEMLAQADRALYRAKEEGRDQYRFHSRELDDLVRERVSVGEELRQAIERKELELYYQPQLAVASGAVVGMEALVRWNHKRRGLLTPAAFVPIAERTGVIFALGHWVLEEACRQLKQWRKEGHAVPSVAVNLSAAQLKVGRDFVADVAEVLNRSGLSPSDLEFDISEAILAEITRRHPDILERLRKLGVGIAIDDFGTDYTAVGSLNAFRVKRFKIAPQFIQAVARTPADANIVRAMIGLAHQLGIEVIAEGVETQEQRDFLLTAADNAEAQGYFYSRPLPAAEATRLLCQYEQAAAAKRVA